MYVSELARLCYSVCNTVTAAVAAAVNDNTVGTVLTRSDNKRQRWRRRKQSRWHFMIHAATQSNTNWAQRYRQSMSRLLAYNSQTAALLCVLWKFCANSKTLAYSHTHARAHARTYSRQNVMLIRQCAISPGRPWLSLVYLPATDETKAAKDFSAAPESNNETRMPIAVTCPARTKSNHRFFFLLTQPALSAFLLFDLIRSDTPTLANNFVRFGLSCLIR